jgi:hypothetical protein
MSKAKHNLEFTFAIDYVMSLTYITRIATLIFFLLMQRLELEGHLLNPFPPKYQ